METKIIKKKKSTDKPKAINAKKETLIKEMISACKVKGIDIRRERLKHGSGWRATSGLCVHQEKPVVFIDSRLEQDEQLDIIITKVRDLNVDFNQDELKNIPLNIQTQLIA